MTVPSMQHRQTGQPVRTASRLTAFARDLWVCQTPGRFLGLEVGCRMTVVRDPGGALFVISPVALHESLRRDVDRLGEVVALILPSIFHHLHIARWAEAYPQALKVACPGLEYKRPEIPFDLVLADLPHPRWADTLAQVYFSARRENEVVFFHRTSRTLICTDAFLNLSHHPSQLTRNVARLIGNSQPGYTHLERFMVRDRTLARRQLARILEWDIDRILLAHGDPIESGGHSLLASAYDWL